MTHKSALRKREREAIEEWGRLYRRAANMIGTAEEIDRFTNEQVEPARLRMEAAIEANRNDYTHMKLDNNSEVR